MALRPIVDTSIGQTPIQPVAAPVDTYVQPAVDQSAGSGLMSLAKSLAGFSPVLDDMMQQRAAKQQQDDAVKAQADFVRNNSAGYADAVAKGLIPASASPAYVDAYKKAQGDVAGQQLELDALNAYNNSPAKTSTDPNAFNTFMSGFLKDRIGTTDPKVLAGFMPRVQQMRQALYAQHMQDQDQQIRQQSGDLITAGASGQLDAAHAAGLASPSGPNYDAAFATMDQQVADWTQKGMPLGDAMKRVEDAVVNQALLHKDSKILDWFDRTVPGQTYSYKSTADGQKAYLDAVDKFDIITRRDKVDQKEQQAAADKAAKNQNEADTIQFIFAHPTASVPQNLITEGTKYDGTFQSKVLGWQKEVRENTAQSDPNARAQINRQVMDDPTNGPNYVIEGFKSGALSPGDFQTDYKFAQDVQKNGPAFQKTLSLPQVTTTMGAIKQRTAPSDFDFSKNPDYMTDDGLRAQSDYRRQIFEWMQAHPDDAKDPLKLNSAVDQIGASILKGITPPTISGDAGAYTAPNGGTGNPFGSNAPPKPATASDPSAGMHERTWSEWWNSAPTVPGKTDSSGYPMVQDAPAPAQAQPPAPTPQAPAQPAAPAKPAAPAPAEDQQYQQWYNGLGAASKQSLDDAAAKSPNPENFKRQVMKSFLARQQPVHKSSFEPGAEDTGGLQPAVFHPGQDLGEAFNAAMSNPQGALDALGQAISQQSDVDNASSSFERALHAPANYVTTSASLASNPRAASILDFIAGPESRGNYNARYGAVDASDDLSKYSLGDILKIQDASRRGGAPSTAIGRYQFLQGTLQGLIHEAGLPLTTKFTPQLQDQLGLMLLRRRGLDDWQAGRLSDAQFVNNLSQEWAGLPSMSGRSFYEGDGLNHAGVTVGQTLGALAGARGGPSSSSPNPFGPGDIYANIPKTDTRGEDQLSKFLQWNPDPVGMQEQHLAEIQPQLADVVRKAQKDNPYLHFAVGAGLRTKAQQQQAIKWGWSKTEDSDHLDGHAVDLWPLDEKGSVIFDKQRQLAVANAMEKAARDLGVNLDVGARWKRFKDLPHFALKRGLAA